MFYHRGSISQALCDLFPDIGIDKAKFYICTVLDLFNVIYLVVDKHSGNRIAFFVEYAKKYGFDPANPENWYSQPSSRILAMKVFSLHSYLY